MQTKNNLKITDIKLYQLKSIREVGSLEPAWDLGGAMQFQEGGGSFVEIHTDQGLVGLGPGVGPELLPMLKAHLIGQDPFEIEKHRATWRYYVRRAAHYRGTACIDIALWNLIGKACGQPLYKLWGGSRDKVPANRSEWR